MPATSSPVPARPIAMPRTYSAISSPGLYVLRRLAPSFYSPEKSTAPNSDVARGRKGSLQIARH
jgi:hypothetical protein